MPDHPLPTVASIRAEAERTVRPEWREVNPTWVLLAEIDRLTAERDAAERALVEQPVLRHCVYPGCLREYDACAGLAGHPVRPSWSSKGWHQIVRGYGTAAAICPDHAAIVTDHLPRWDQSGDRPVLGCACGWSSSPVRWPQRGRAEWQEHLMDVAEEETPDA